MFCALLIVLNKKMGLKVQLALLYILVIWWTIGVAVCTFIGPFNVTGNGYFGEYITYFEREARINSRYTRRMVCVRRKLADAA